MFRRSSGKTLATFPNFQASQAVAVSWSEASPPAWNVAVEGPVFSRTMGGSGASTLNFTVTTIVGAGFGEHGFRLRYQEPQDHQSQWGTRENVLSGNRPVISVQWE